MRTMSKVSGGPELGGAARPAPAPPNTDIMRSLIELIQRGRMIVDVATADLAASEARLGSFHETTWYFRQALAEARKSWERLRAEVGSRQLEQALAHPSLTHLSLELAGNLSGPFLLVTVAGRTYQALSIPGTALAPTQWRLSSLLPEVDVTPGTGQHDPYFIVRLQDGSTQCDCAEWIYRVADTERLATAGAGCKHILALESLGWI